jgi:hypothetical protein
MKKFSIFSILTFFLYFTACNGDNSSTPSYNENSAYSSEQTSYIFSSSTNPDFSSSAGFTLNGRSSSSSEDPGIIVMPPLQSSSSVTYHFENKTGERVTCKGPYTNLVIGHTQYFKSYHCKDGNTCAPYTAAACSETECRSINLYACKDDNMIEVEDFNKRYVLDTCKGGYCEVYCYNNEIALDDGDTLNVIECENGLTYLRDGALDRKRAGKSIPDTILESPQRGANCDYGEQLCVDKTESGFCFLTLTTIECPRKEQQD